MANTKNLVLAAALSLLAAGCIIGGPEPYPEPCCGSGVAGDCGIPDSGVARLLARTLGGVEDEGAYEAATISFQYATVYDTERVRNDWDLLFGNDFEADVDRFEVNTVVDDDSYIVDLGAIELAKVPHVIRPGDYATGKWGEHDAIPVVKGHVYVVRTLDADTSQLAAFKVLDHLPNEAVVIEWHRSYEAEHYLPVPPEEPVAAE